jgi:hypothetical protein
MRNSERDIDNKVSLTASKVGASVFFGCTCTMRTTPSLVVLFLLEYKLKDNEDEHETEEGKNRLFSERVVILAYSIRSRKTISS